MKSSEIRKLSIEEIKEVLKTKKQQYQKMKFDHGVNFLKKPVDIFFLRKEISCLKTILNEKISK